MALGGPRPGVQVAALSWDQVSPLLGAAVLVLTSLAYGQVGFSINVYTRNPRRKQSSGFVAGNAEPAEIAATPRF